MEAYLMKMFGISLALTIVVELSAAFILRPCMKHLGREGERPVLGSKRHLALLVVLVNLLTNPPAVLLSWLGRMYLPFLAVPVQLSVELAVVAVEAWIYRGFMEKPGWQTGRPVLLAVVANVCSWTIGIVCGRWIDLAVTVALRLRQVW